MIDTTPVQSKAWPSPTAWDTDKVTGLTPEVQLARSMSAQTAVTTADVFVAMEAARMLEPSAALAFTLKAADSQEAQQRQG